MGMGVSIRAIGLLPTYTTKIVICPSCGAMLEVTISSIVEENKELTCPPCQASIEEKGVSIRHLPYGKWLDWLKKYWPYLAVGGLGTGLVITLTKRRK